MRALAFTLGAALLLVAPMQAAVIQLPGRIEVEGVIDGDGSSPPGIRGDTMDYLTFEVRSTGSVTFTSGFGSGLRMQLASFIGVEDEFGFLGNPFRLEQTSEEPATFTRTLDPGVYVTAMGVRENTSYDVFDGYQPVNEEGGGFTFGPYAYTITGDVRALEFREGNLDNTFTITQIPEPSATILALCCGALLATRRRRKPERGALPKATGTAAPATS